MKLIADTSFFINYHYQLPNQTQIVTTPEVKDELRSVLTSLKYLVVIESFEFSIIVPDKKYKLFVTKKSDEVGQKWLSEADFSILALGVKFKAEKKGNFCIATEDFAIINMSRHLNLISKQLFVKKKVNARKYTYKCRGCKEAFNYKTNECDVCGHKTFSRFY